MITIEQNNGLSVWWDFDGKAIFVTGIGVGAGYTDEYFQNIVLEHIHDCSDAWQPYCGKTTAGVIAEFQKEYGEWHKILPIGE